MKARARFAVLNRCVRFRLQNVRSTFPEARAMERRDLGKPKRVVVGSTAARCSRCGGEDFVRMNRRASHERSDILICYSCGDEHFYSELLQQIAACVIARSERLLEELRAKHGALPLQKR
jgi:superfamily II helicase